MTQKNYILAGIVVLFGLLAVGAVMLSNINLARGAQTLDTPANLGRYVTFEFFASTTASTVLATSTSATSTNIVAYFDSNGIRNDGSFSIVGAKRVEVYFTRGNAFGTSNLGTTTFSIQGTPDGTNWYYINRLVVSTTSPASTFSNAFVQNSDPASGAPTIGAQAPGSIATSTIRYSLDLSTETFKAIRCIAAAIATGTPDGSAQCAASALF